MVFKDRKEAGKRLAINLQKYKKDEGVILAIPRGGVAVAFEVAKLLKWPMDLMLIKKLGHPKQKEYAIGAVSLKSIVVLPHPDVFNDYIKAEADLIRQRLREMRKIFLGYEPPVPVSQKTVIVIDDGIATGNTLLAGIELLKEEKPKKIIVAAPVASKSSVEAIGKEVDEVVVLDIPEKFIGVGQFYENFTQVTDEEVISDLQKIGSGI
jgi:putative phosphoribosyl transferase